MDLEAYKNWKGRLRTPLPCRGNCSLPSEVTEAVTVLCSYRWFSKTESTLNTDSCLKPGVTYVVTSASDCCKTVKTTISSIFNSGKIFFFQFKLTLEYQSFRGRQAWQSSACWAAVSHSSVLEAALKSSSVAPAGAEAFIHTVVREDSEARGGF